MAKRKQNIIKGRRAFCGVTNNGTYLIDTLSTDKKLCRQEVDRLYSTVVDNVLIRPSKKMVQVKSLKVRVGR